MSTAGVVVGRIGDGTLNLAADCEFAHALTRRPFKFTCTGPHMLARLLTNDYYPDLPILAMGSPGEPAVSTRFPASDLTTVTLNFLTAPQE